jgi:hypothetical protein
MANDLDLTTVYAQSFDVKRQLAGKLDSVCNLVRLKPAIGDDAGGYAKVGTLSQGWNSRRVTRKALGQEFFEVKFADVANTLTALVDTTVPTHVHIDGLMFEISAIARPVKATRVWLFRCQPTGEVVTLS